MRRQVGGGVTVAFALSVAIVGSAVGAVTMSDRAAEAGIASTNNTWAATVLDHDNDGDQDVWIGYHQAGVVKGTLGAGKLWSNDGDGTYTWVARNAWPRVNANGLITDRHDCAFADVDLNGLADAYCSAGRNESNLVKNGRDNELWLQTAVGSFTEVGTAWGVGDVCGRGRHVAFLDANGDPYPDIFLGNETPRSDPDDPCNSSPSLPNENSKIFLNNGGRSYTHDANSGINAAGPGQRCAEVLDYNGDGWDDLLACRLKAQTPRLYRNNAGQGFTEVSAAAGLTTATSDAGVADFNGDGRPDLAVSNKAYFGYRLNTGGRFSAPTRIYTVSSGEGRSVAVGDADTDGDLDVFAMTWAPSGNPTDVLLTNQAMTFTAVVAPPALGAADEVIALRPTGGATQFLTLNGGDKLGGTTQLLRLVP